MEGKKIIMLNGLFIVKNRNLYLKIFRTRLNYLSYYVNKKAFLTNAFDIFVQVK